MFFQVYIKNICSRALKKLQYPVLYTTLLAIYNIVFIFDSRGTLISFGEDSKQTAYNRSSSIISKIDSPPPLFFYFFFYDESEYNYRKYIYLSFPSICSFFSTFPLWYSSNWTFLTFFCSYTQACDPIIHESLWKLGLFLHWRIIMGA